MADIGGKLEKTAEASKLLFRSKEYITVFILVSLAFLSLFIVAMQDISINNSFETGFRTVSDPLSTAFESRAPFQWEPVAQIKAGYLNILLSPLNLSLGLVLAVLTGINLVFSYIAWRQPHICSANKSTGILSSVPAILAGSACCAPVILILLGVQITTALLTFMSFLIPLAVVLLLTNIVVSANKVRIDRLKEEVG
jgi:hypothetical protein